MTGNKVLLDSNIVIELFKGNQLVTNSFNSNNIIHIPFAVLGELYLGAYRSANAQKHLNQINDFLRKCIVLNANEDTANNYALIKSTLLNKGKPIPENDIWIAAIAQQHQITLITKDKHFNEIENLTIENW